jgi:hypothetical protein
MRNVNKFEKKDSSFFSDGKGGFSVFEFLLWLIGVVIFVVGIIGLIF